MLPLSIFGSCIVFRRASEAPPKIFSSRVATPHACELRPTTSTSLATPLCGYELLIAAFVSPSTLPPKSMSLQETPESRVTAPHMLFLLQLLSVHRAKTSFNR